MRAGTLCAGLGAVALAASGCDREPEPATPPPESQAAVEEPVASRGSILRPEVKAEMTADVAPAPQPLEALVYFDLGTADLSDAARADLEVFATSIPDPSWRIELAGRTDPTGDAALNRRLARQRAEAVRDHLLTLGVDPQRLTVSDDDTAQVDTPPESALPMEEARRVDLVARPAPSDASETLSNSADQTD